jgi:ammonia channel protein AmtB
MFLIMCVSLFTTIDLYVVCFLCVLSTSYHHYIYLIQCNFINVILIAGGTIQVHMFGAFFGVSAAIMLGNAPAPAAVNSDSSHTSDLFSMLGTLFLFIYLPSFNASELVPGSAAQQRAEVNTVLALCASTVAAFATSSILHKTWKFRPVDIQRATLAGGVAVGAVCNYTLNAYFVLMLGMAAGMLSTYCFVRLRPVLQGKYGVYDTCGVRHLFAMPSLLGALVSVFVATSKAPLHHDMPQVFAHIDQGGRQLAAILATLAVAVAGGVLTGMLLQRFITAPIFDPETCSGGDEALFHDSAYWQVDPYLEDEIVWDTEDVAAPIVADAAAVGEEGGDSSRNRDEERGGGGVKGGNVDGYGDILYEDDAPFDDVDVDGDAQVQGNRKSENSENEHLTAGRRRRTSTAAVVEEVIIRHLTRI